MKHSKKSLALAILLSLGVCSNAWAQIEIGDNFKYGNSVYADPDNSIAIGLTANAISKESNAIGHQAYIYGGTANNAIGWGAEITSSSYSNAFGYFANTTGSHSNAFGDQAAAIADYTSAIGFDTIASGIYSNAMGVGATASGANSIAIGSGTVANGLPVNEPIASGDYSIALGTGAKASAENAVAIGRDSVADVANTISVGAKGAERRIVNVDKATTNTDALTFGNFTYNTTVAGNNIITSMKIGTDQYYFTGGGSGNTVDENLDVNSIHPVQNKAIAIGINNEAAAREAADNNLQSQIDNMDSDVKSVGAMAAAMAGLHPRFTGDGKGEVAAAIGSYDGKKATAIGAFYAPDERFMFSLGGAFAAGGKKMANLGVNIALDPKPHVNKKFYDEEIAQLKADNQAQAEQIQMLMQRLSALEAKK